jgi:precorrin-6B methylase 2
MRPLHQIHTGLLQRLLALRDGQPVTLMDVGAAGGVDQRWQLAGPHLHVVGLEPNPDEYE